jgi:O-6-methylguanine DNA methyltransferase
MRTVEEIITFLETDIFSAAFSPKGLQYLSLRADEGFKLLDLRKETDFTPTERLIVQETSKFIRTGNHDMPLDLSSFTSFEQSVFHLVSKIKPGELTTYKAIAENLGKPKGARAVGNAIAQNPVSFFLPTHRILSQKGIGTCKSGAGHLREKFLAHEGHDLSRL